MNYKIKKNNYFDFILFISLIYGYPKLYIELFETLSLKDVKDRVHYIQVLIIFLGKYTQNNRHSIIINDILFLLNLYNLHSNIANLEIEDALNFIIKFSEDTDYNRWKKYYNAYNNNIYYSMYCILGISYRVIKWFLIDDYTQQYKKKK
jgi:hypothetical protein